LRRWLKITARLDTECVRRNIFSGRDRAGEEIRKGLVEVSGKVITKPSFKVGEEEEIVYKGEELKVSRAQLKLRKALSEFKVSPSGKNCLDVGASTGGFTEELLNAGALSVTSLDVGHGQLREELKMNPKVHNMEGYNFRYAKSEDFKEKFSLITMDVSFISVTLMSQSVKLLLEDGGDFIVLIKPQFEAGRSALNSKGVVTDIKDRERILISVSQHYKDEGFELLNAVQSPIKGPEGNTEYLLHFGRQERQNLTAEDKDIMELLKGNI